jgi:hypothetical protein
MMFSLSVAVNCVAAGGAQLGAVCCSTHPAGLCHNTCSDLGANKPQVTAAFALLSPVALCRLVLLCAVAMASAALLLLMGSFLQDVSVQTRL